MSVLASEGAARVQRALPRAMLRALVERALQEDLAGGDVTSEACVSRDAQADALASARHPMVVCGGEVFAEVFSQIDASLAVALLQPDGSSIEAGAPIWRVRGCAQSILAGERVALNFCQRMTGIATMAQRYVRALAPESRTRIADTRKTTPGLRLIERYAVQTGGAHNHRDNLGSAVMIKDNHIVAAGGIGAAIARARGYAPHTCRIEVEVTSLAELDEALAGQADIVMLDNMDTPLVREALARIGTSAGDAGRPIVEVSGGITLERVAELSAEGVDVISVGALTHSAPAADISLGFSLA